jgi:hypothetical protein
MHVRIVSIAANKNAILNAKKSEMKGKFQEKIGGREKVFFFPQVT